MNDEMLGDLPSLYALRLDAPRAARTPGRGRALAFYLISVLMAVGCAAVASAGGF